MFFIVSTRISLVNTMFILVFTMISLVFSRISWIYNVFSCISKVFYVPNIVGPRENVQGILLTHSRRGSAVLSDLWPAPCFSASQFMRGRPARTCGCTAASWRWRRWPSFAAGRPCCRGRCVFGQWAWPSWFTSRGLGLFSWVCRRGLRRLCRFTCWEIVATCNYRTTSNVNIKKLSYSILMFEPSSVLMWFVGRFYEL